MQKMEKRLQVVVDQNVEVDRWQKALTGRRPEQYAAESGLPQDELFPPDKQVLNIGDPWQVIDLPNVTCIDYESGREAQFVDESEIFEDILYHDSGILYQVSEYSDVDGDIKEAIAETMHEAEQVDIELFDEVGNRFLQIAEDMGEDGGGFNQKEIWYALQSLGWAFKDMYLSETVIEPAIDEETKRQKGITDMQREQIRQGLITAHRFRTKLTKSEYIKDAFPSADIPDHSFDRIVASWSISTHAFRAMNPEQFSLYWNQIDRILTKDGAAYMWPIDRGKIDEIVKSLMQYTKEGGKVATFHEIAGFLNHKADVVWFDPHDTKRFEDKLLKGGTLVILPKGARKYMVERVENAVKTKIEDYNNEDEKAA